MMGSINPNSRMLRVSDSISSSLMPLGLAGTGFWAAMDRWVISNSRFTAMACFLTTKMTDGNSEDRLPSATDRRVKSSTTPVTLRQLSGVAGVALVREEPASDLPNRLVPQALRKFQQLVEGSLQT